MSGTIKRYVGIASHPDHPGEGLVVHVDAYDLPSAEDACYDATDQEGGIYEGYDFTIWPEPCDV